MIGALRYQIELIAETASPDEAGGAARSATPAGIVWAAVDHLPTISTPVGDRLARARRVRALVRNRADLAVGGRLRFNSVDYRITSIESDDERGRRVYLIGEEIFP